MFMNIINELKHLRNILSLCVRVKKVKQKGMNCVSNKTLRDLIKVSHVK